MLSLQQKNVWIRINQICTIVCSTYLSGQVGKGDMLHVWLVRYGIRIRAATGTPEGSSLPPDNDEQPSNSSAFLDWDILKDVAISAASKDQTWSKDENKLLLNFNTQVWKRLIMVGDNYKYESLHKYYNLAARQKKYRNSSALVFIRTAKMIQEKIKSLKRAGNWTDPSVASLV